MVIKYKQQIPRDFHLVETIKTYGPDAQWSTTRHWKINSFESTFLLQQRKPFKKFLKVKSNLKVPSSNLTRRVSGLRDLVSLRGFCHLWHLIDLKQLWDLFVISVKIFSISGSCSHVFSRITKLFFYKRLHNRYFLENFPEIFRKGVS